jgi:putative transposase
VIAHAVWLYFRFHLSFRDVEELLAERGIIVSHEAIRHWCYTFGPGYAADLRRRRAQPGDKWHLDEVLLKIAGTRHWLWRAVDQNGIVLDILVQERRDQVAAERFLRQVLASCEYEPRVVITDKLMSYVPAIRRVVGRQYLGRLRRHVRIDDAARSAQAVIGSDRSSGVASARASGVRAFDAVGPGCSRQRIPEGPIGGGARRG